MYQYFVKIVPTVYKNTSGSVSHCCHLLQENIFAKVM